MKLARPNPRHSPRAGRSRSPARLWLRTAAVAAWLACALPAAAHLGNLSYSEIDIRGAQALLRLKFAAHLIPGGVSGDARRMTRPEVVARERDVLEWLARTVKIETAAGACTPEIVDLVGPDENDDLKIGLGFSCPAPAESSRIEFHAFDESMPDYRNIVSVHMGETTAGFVFTRDTPVLVLGDFGGEETRSRFREFFELGVEHIWTGYDHLLFLLALLLPGGSMGRVAGIVTAFTIAHSITLALAALDIVRLPVEPVEIAIAGSIVFAAAAALRSGGVDRRWIITFAFGLIHGFGFASVLRESGLPPGSALVPLLAFNLGVEAGQLAIVVVAVPLLRMLTRGARGLAARRALAWATIAIGVFWMTERTAAWLGI